MNLALFTLLAPFAAFAALGLVPPLRRSGRPAAILSIAAVGLSLASALILFARYAARPEIERFEFLWAPLSGVPEIRFGILIDGLAVAMLVVVTLVAFLVQVYSLGYMSGESRAALGRYYAYHSLFTFSMLGLVLAHNVLQTYVFWELVGVCSYLLIGFWFHKPEAARAALKAFWTTRLGDVGFAIGVVLLWSAGGTFTFEELFHKAEAGLLAPTLLTLGVAGLYLGAMGKSAQFPLHIWLPDAMEGPTPVSALIHAATMVAAGVYLMVRIQPLLSHTPELATIVLGIGVLTAVVAASMALVERDVKRVLAFSTVSQLGYMMAAAGAGAAVAAFYHLFTHAFFKALLFLAAGSVIHAVGTNDIFKMGRLWKPMRTTGALFLIGGVALAGVFPTAGFFSKDEILAALWTGGHPWAMAALLLAAGMTAFYMFRAFFLVFFGANTAAGHPHESPAVMTWPMGVLALLALGAGALGHTVAKLLHYSISLSQTRPEHAPLWLPLLATAAALGGIALAWAGYQARSFSPERVRRAAGPLAVLLERRYFIDEVFLAVYRVAYLGVSTVIGWTDRYLIDGVVNYATWFTQDLALRARRIQNGKVQDALYAVVLGLLVIAALALR